MLKLILPLTLLPIAAASWQARPSGTSTDRGTSINMKEERLVVEYTATRNEAVLKLHAESEQTLRSLELCDPLGRVLLRLNAESDEGVVSGVNFETREGTPEEIFAACMEGTYELLGRTLGGERARGSALLSHDLLPAPKVLYPLEGAGAPTRGLKIRWQPDGRAAGYMVCLEQDDNDGLMVHLPPGSSSLLVPPGVLRPGKQAYVEVGAVGRNGNCTLVEVRFTPL